MRVNVLEELQDKGRTKEGQRRRQLEGGGTRPSTYSLHHQKSVDFKLERAWSLRISGLFLYYHVFTDLKYPRTNCNFG